MGTTTTHEIVGMSEGEAHEPMQLIMIDPYFGGSLGVAHQWLVGGFKYAMSICCTATQILSNINKVKTQEVTNN